MKKKLKSSSGLTLVEMLCAAVILGLLGLLVSAGIRMAVKTYRDLTAQAETQLLLSTAASAIADELRYARDVTVDGAGNLTAYRSASFGAGARLTVDQATGHILAGGMQLLPPGRQNAGGRYEGGAYKGDAYRFETLEIDGSAYEADGCFAVKLKVVWQEDPAICAQTDLTVRCLNPKKDAAGGVI